MIELRGVSKRYGEVQAASDVSFTIPNGLVTGLVGPNGAGKSTVMRLILGLEDPDAGTVRDSDRGRPLAKGIAGMLDPSWCYGRRTAFDHLWMLAAAQGVPKQRVSEALESTGLTSVARRRIATFSLGMRQRLGIATILLGEPATVLLDEPVNGLDPEGVWWVRTLCRSLAQRGVAVLVSSHLLSELAQTADRIVVIAAGRVRAEGDLTDFLAEGPRETVASADNLALLAQTCRAAGAEVAKLGDTKIVISRMDPLEVSRLAHGAGVLLTHLEAKHQTLEERFVELTAEHAQYRVTPAAPEAVVADGELR